MFHKYSLFMNCVEVEDIAKPTTTGFLNIAKH